MRLLVGTEELLNGLQEMRVTTRLILVLFIKASDDETHQLGLDIG